MKKNLPYAIYPLCALLCFVLLFCFRSQKENTLWQNYKVLVVPMRCNANDVAKTLHEAGISAITPLNSTCYVANKYAPIVNFDDEYTTEIKKYFYDESKNYQIFYLKDEPQLQKKVQKLFFDKELTSGWRFETNSSVGYFGAIVPFIVAIVFFVLCKKRIFFVLAQVSFLLASVFSPMVQTCSIACVSAVIIYYVQHFWQKPSWIEYLKKDIFLRICAVLLVALAFSAGFKSLLFFALAIVPSIALILCYYRYSEENKSVYTFITSAKTNRLSIKQKLYLASTLMASMLVLISFFAIKAQFFATGGLNGLSIPVPTQYNSESGFSHSRYEELVQQEKRSRSLPNLAHFIELKWYSAVYPYLPVSLPLEKPIFGAKVSIKEYHFEQKTSAIKESKKELFVFDDAYLQSVFDEIALHPFTAEYLLAQQQQFVTVAYKQF